jgi:hypothetical protein
VEVIMPGCVLRASGRDFDVDEFLANSILKPCAVWRRGESRWKSRPPSDVSGFNLVVSEAPGEDFRAQVKESIAFLTAHHEELAILREAVGNEHSVLDFGVILPDDLVFGQSNVFPAELVRLAGELGLGIELSLYPPGRDESEE